MKTERFFKVFTYNVREPYTKRIWINIEFFTIDSKDVLEKYNLYNYLVSLGFLEIKKYDDLKKDIANKTIYIKSRYSKDDDKPVIFLDEKYNKAMPINIFNNILKQDKYLYKVYKNIKC